MVLNTSKKGGPGEIRASGGGWREGGGGEGGGEGPRAMDG